MECPFCAGWPVCDYAVELEVLTEALDEAEELRTALNAQTDQLRRRIRQLESTLTSAGLPVPDEEADL